MSRQSTRAGVLCCARSGTALANAGAKALHRTMVPDSGRPPGVFARFLNVIERAGNALPHPATLFVALGAFVLVLSAVCASAGLSVKHPGTGAEVAVTNLLSVEGLHRIIGGMVPNFVGFPPLGPVLLALLGIGVAEATGLIGTALRSVVLAAPRGLLTPIIVFCGVMSNIGGDVGYVLLVPLAAAAFHAVGRHPVLGLAAAFAGVSGGFSANLLLGTLDPLLAGITQSAAVILKPGYVVLPTANYYFMAVSTFLVTGIGWWVTERLVAPRFGAYTGPAGREAMHALTPAETRGLVWAAAAGAGLVALVLAGLLPEGGFLRDLKNPGSILASPFITGITVFIFLSGLIPGIAYGIGAGTVKSDGDVLKGMNRSMETMAGYLVLAFFCAQFIAWFNWSNLGVVLAVGGAGLLEPLRNQPILLLVGLVVVAAAINLVMSSASAKWALLAPVVVPMFILLGYSPETVQAAYRVGDSVTNIITPLMAYFPLVLTFAQRYEPKAGIGTLLAAMLPYSLAFLLGWTVLLAVWIGLELPFGPGVSLRLP